MSDEPLVSPEEVASVLSSGDGESADTPDPSAAGGPDRFSLRRPVAISREAEPFAKRRAQRFAQLISEILGSELEVGIEAEVQGFQQRQVTDALDSMPSPSWVIALKHADVGGLALILDPACALTLVELALGGQGNDQAEGREPTQLESRVMTNLARSILKPLSRKIETSFNACSFIVDRVPPEIAAPGEMVGAALLNLRLGGTERSGMLLATAGLLKAPPAAPVQRSNPKGPIASRLALVPVEVRPVLEVGRVSLRDITDLKEGAVLKFETAESEALDLRVAGRTLFRGHICKREGATDFRIEWRRGMGEGVSRQEES